MARPAVTRGLAAAAVMLVAAAAAALLLREPSAPERALAIARDAPNFETAAGAGVAFARIADLLFEEGRRCGRNAGRDEVAACAKLLAASVDPQIAAYRVLRCTPADVDLMRRALLADLEALANDERPQGPRRPMPTCR